MDMETWGPLVGVVIGAVLGGFAQIVNAHISARRDQKASQREIRRLAYVDLLRCCSTLRGQTIDLDLRKVEPKLSSTLPSAASAARVAMDSLYSARAELDLVAPQDTAEAGRNLANLHLEFLSVDGDQEALLIETAHAYGEFMVLAKRDVGIDLDD